MATTFNFKDFMNQKQAPVVQAGKYENVLIEKYEEQTSNNSTFIRFTFKLSDGRTISDNRFQQGLAIMFSHLREQLELQSEEISPKELFDKCKNTKFTLWVEKTTVVNKNTGATQRVTNLHFLEPLNKVSETVEAVEAITDDEIPN